MRMLAAIVLVSLSISALGCMAGTEEPDEDVTAEAEEALLAYNAITPNAITPNAITPNAITPNALTPSTVSSGVMAALQDPGQAGALSREHVKYLVSCALLPGDHFDFTWTDSNQQPHNESYPGLLGLAPAWVTRGLIESEQRWVSACMAARANYYETTVLISMRGDHASLGADNTERSQYSAREGAFWGNIFVENPTVFTCYDPANVTNSRTRLRDCAAGHVDGLSVVECGPIKIVGPCDELIGDPAAARCPEPATSGDGYPTCDQKLGVITTYLPAAP